MPIERIEYDDLRLSFAPVTLVNPGMPLGLTLKLEPAPDDARVEVEFQKNADQPQRQLARRDSEGQEAHATRFVLELPPFDAGDHVRVTVIGSSGDRRVPAVGDEALSTFAFDVSPPGAIGAPSTLLLEQVEQLVPPGESRRARSVLEKLRDRGINTGTDLLTADFDNLAGLSAQEKKTAGRLAAHAALSLTVPDTLERRGLIKAGFTNLADIAVTPLPDFRKAVGNDLNRQRAVETHRAASLQVAFLNNLATGNGVAKTALGITGAGTEQQCGCEDCEAATSPLAYLADLVTYIGSTMSFWQEVPGGFQTQSPLSLGALSDLLQQPLKDLVVSCAATSDPVRKVRLIIETLRRHLRANVPADADVLCSPFALPLEFVVAGDVDGDGRDELIVAFRGSLSSWLELPPGVLGGFFVMDFNSSSQSWSHLRPMPDLVGADFLLSPGLVAKAAFCADIDDDGRAEIVISVGNSDGTADPQLGKTWLWVMDFDPAQGGWQHLPPGTFAQARADLWLDDPTLDILHVFGADVDGDGNVEIAIAVASPARPNAFWVYDLVTVAGQPIWQALSPGSDASLPAFECDPPAPGYASYRPRLALAGNVTLNGRDEIVAFPDAPGALGSGAWVIAYDPPNPPVPGTVGVWRHVNPNPGSVSADLEGTWPWPAPAAHAFVGSTRGLNGWSLLLAPQATAGSDPNSFYEVRYDVTAVPPWTFPVQIDCTTKNREVTKVFAADVDGDLTDELVAVIKSQGRRSAWVMDRRPDGTWQHLTPLPGHVYDADLEWTGLDYVFQGALAADVDLVRSGSLHKELVFYGTSCNQIWVMHYNEVTKAWRHVSPVLPADLDERYLLAAYQALLAEIGASFEDLRNARGAEDADRRALAERLGLPLRRGANQPDTIDRLLITPADLSEVLLEELFGLVDTTRNPLSSGLVRGAENAQIRRFELEGIEWSRNPWVANVSPEGELSLNLTKLPGGNIRVELVRVGGLLVASGEGNATGRVRLSEQGGSGLSGWVELAYVRDTTNIEIRTLPLLTAWRLDHLRSVWDSQDWLASPFDTGGGPGSEPALPIIDPDVIGPDDFRVPLEKASAGDPDGTFDLWVKRRAWIDGRLTQLRSLQPNLATMLNTLRPPAGPIAAPEDYPWDSAPPETDFPKLAQALTRRDADAEAAQATVRTKLWLPPDAFLRLVALREQLQQAQQLSEAEWEEVRSILVLALKRRRYDIWRNEEQAAGIALDARWFWGTVRPPAEGEWPPIVPAGDVLVDPDVLALADLPQGSAGGLARGLWQARRVQLDALAGQIRAEKPNGFETMLVSALGNAPAGTTWQARITILAVDLDSSDQARSQQARSDIQSQFGLAPTPFRRLAAVNARIIARAILSEAEWLDVESLLTSARKRKLEYAAWLQEEQALGVLLPYWRARRAWLPRWRARAEHRQAWEEELRRYSRLPVVDPDVLPATWLRRRVFGEPAADAYTTRRTWLSSQAELLRNLRQPASSLLAQFDSVLRIAFFPTAEVTCLLSDLRRRRQAQSPAAVLLAVFRASVAEITALQADLASANPSTKARAQARVVNEFWLDPAEFDKLATIAAKVPAAVTNAEWVEFDRILTDASLLGRIVGLGEEAKRSGVRSRVLLDQLGLRPAAHSRLLHTRRLAAAGGPILDTEWEVVIAIALRAEKVRRYGEWLVQELGTTPDRRIRLGPDHFAIPEDDGNWEPPEWLVIPEENRRWRDTLRARVEQQKTVMAGLRNVVGRVEEITLSILLDALLKAVAPPDSDAAGWVSSHFLLDPYAGACQATTRAAHAIDTLLALLWSLRTGQINQAYPQLHLFAPSFDADWRWIGSYTSWRSAVLARLYPENLLRPSLRRHKTPVFAEILRELRSGRVISPTDAQQLARKYANYFRDVCSLDLSNLACTHVDGWTRRDDGASGTKLRPHDFLFAVSEASGKVYWSTIEQTGQAHPSGYEQSFWQELTAQTGNVVGLVGAATYAPRRPTPHAMASGWVYLFALTRDLERTSLVFVRFNLITRQWDAGQELDTQVLKNTQFTASILAGDPFNPPRLGFVATRVENGITVTELYVATMDPKGTGWDGQGVRKLTWSWSSITGQLAAVPRELLAIDSDGDGIFDLAAVPAGANPVGFLTYSSGSLAARGMTSRPIETDSQACVGDFDADGRMEIAWTLSPLPMDAGRSTAVLIEKRSAAGQWAAHWPDPARADGASAAGTDQQLRLPFLVVGDVDRVNRDEILLAIPDHFQLWIPRGGGGTGYYTGSWGSFWAITSFGQRYRRNAPFTYVPDPDNRTRYARDELGAAFACASGEIAMALAVTGDFDGDTYDELVIFLAPTQSDSSRGNDFWALDCRAAGSKLRPLGVVLGIQLETVGDLSSDPTVVAAAVAADVDGDGRDEVVVIPYVKDDAARGSRVWIADFQPGGGPDPAEGGYWSTLHDINLTGETTPVVHVVGADLDGDGRDELILFGIGKLWVRKYDPAKNDWIELPEPPANILQPGDTVAVAVAGKFIPGDAEQIIVALGTARSEQTFDSISFNWSSDTATRSRYVRTPNSTAVRLLSLNAPGLGAVRTQCAHTGIKPVYQGSEDDWVLDDTANIDYRRARTMQAWQENAGMPGSMLTYLWEAFYDLPLAIALQLQRSRHFVSALDWFKLIYDRTQPLQERKTFYGLVLDEQAGAGGWSDQSLLDWLRDPLDIYAVAATRPHTFTRATILLTIRCLLDYGDAEFTTDTSESITRAKEIYEAALALLRLPLFDQTYDGCSVVIGRVTARLGDPEVRSIARRLGSQLARVADRSTLESSLEALLRAVSPVKTLAERIETASGIAARELERVPLPATLADATANRAKAIVYDDILRKPAVAAALVRIGELALAPTFRLPEPEGARQPLSSALMALAWPEGDGVPMLWGPSSGYDISFCASPNPLLKALRLHAELNLFKIRTCRNIAGLRRTLEFYSAATDQRSGLPMIGANGELAPLASQVRQPTPYRYPVLVERAKDLVKTAQQLEALMLNAIERRDNEALALLQARQNTRVARETVRLNELQVRQAEDRVTRIQLQQERAQIEQDHYTQLLEAGQLEYELEALSLLSDAVDFQRTAAILGWAATTAYASQAIANSVAAGVSAYYGQYQAAVQYGAAASTAGTQAISSASSVQSIYAQIKSTQSQMASMRASFERVRQEWQLRQQLATQDIRIAAQERQIEEDGVRITEQQRTISELQLDNAERMVDFLNNKFTSVELYDWMSQVLEETYASMLQHAAATARLAVNQLMFERPDSIPPTIGQNYWLPPAEFGIADVNESSASVNRRGLTGAERLLQDLIDLDQYAFLNIQRKLQLTKTFSLAQLLPLELERLRTTGVMTFATPSELLDRDFPGHYLRLIRRVSVSLIALVPPNEGIHATLSSGGTSRVVIGPEIFSPIILHHGSQSVALTAPVSTTGVFTFEPQSELMNPFENDGIDTSWEFSLPQAGNRFDFGTIADLLITIDYTALFSDDYRQQVIRQLDRRFTGEHLLSLRYDFPDAWWDLHNPEQSPPAMTVKFDTIAQDFPPNVDDLEIEHLAFVLVARERDPQGISVRLKFTEKQASTVNTTPPSSWLEAAPVDGVISTRRGNAGSWLGLLGKSPIGQWGLSLPDTDEVRDWLKCDQLSDLLLVISYRGRTPAWPT